MQQFNADAKHGAEQKSVSISATLDRMDGSGCDLAQSVASR
ncbi:hypothetical protein RHI9324_04624 [Rhizobium sp. CECT 9324]|nr:hypothetical protein RHI9324_04624 [Rhizobium sp. CECT 9324]